MFKWTLLAEISSRDLHRRIMHARIEMTNFDRLYGHLYKKLQEAFFVDLSEEIVWIENELAFRRSINWDIIDNSKTIIDKGL